MGNEMNSNKSSDYAEFKKSEKGRQLVRQSEEAAASFVFDLQSGTVNENVANMLSPHEIYMGCTLASSLTFNAAGKDYTVSPYYSQLGEDEALELLQDVQSCVETALLESHCSSLR